MIDPRTYQVITRDVISRHCLPFSVDCPIFAANLKYVHFNRYYGQSVKRHVKSEVSNNSVVGSNAKIGENTVIHNCVIGNGCTIGKDVTIRDSIVWDNVVINDQCKISNALIADNCTLGAGCVLTQGSVMDNGVELSPGATLETIASCLSVCQSKDSVSFERNLTTGAEFVCGNTCQLPQDMQLTKH